MKKKLLFVLAIACCSAAAHAQVNDDYWQKAGYLLKFSKNYFRSDPFAGEFSGFLKHLLNDPGITGRVVRKKTDTSLYVVHGIYTSYNPFFFKPKRVEVMLEETPVEYNDSLHTTDTIFTYQLMAYADDNGDGRREIIKEFEKIHRQVNRQLESNYKEVKEGTAVTAAVHNYFMPLYFLSPLSLAWGRLDTKQELVLNITLRIKVRANQTVLPAMQLGRHLLP
ncbi:MAG: hypothetical protein ABW019_05385 [Chitinophagaceae bacterium]